MDKTELKNLLISSNKIYEAFKSDKEIISEEKARKLNPDFFLVTPWGFIKEFVKRETIWLKKGGKFILPFPNFKLIK